MLTYIYIYIYIFICLYTCKHNVCVCVCIYIYIYIYTYGSFLRNVCGESQSSGGLWSPCGVLVKGGLAIYVLSPLLMPDIAHYEYIASAKMTPVLREAMLFVEPRCFVASSKYDKHVPRRVLWSFVEAMLRTQFFRLSIRNVPQHPPPPPLSQGAQTGQPIPPVICQLALLTQAKTPKLLKFWFPKVWFPKFLVSYQSKNT